jgi:hypothetical protein
MKVFYLVFLSLFFGVQKITAQTYSFKATAYSVQEKNDGKWGKWSDFVESTVVITIDGKKSRVVVGSKEIQLYYIENFGEKVVTPTTETIQMNCLDNSGKPVVILVVTRKNQDNRKQFYVNFDDVRFVYNVYEQL